MAAYEWYFARCQAGREDSVCKQLIKRLAAAGLEGNIPQILVPVEKVTDLRAGKKRIVKKKLYPGYLMIQADLSDPECPEAIKARSTLKSTRGFGEFLGMGGEPTPIPEDEVASILARMSESEDRPKVAIGLKKGDVVKVKSGAFDGFDGAVDEINPDKGTVRVIVTIFGRPTPVELEYWEVEAV
ncbi:MAG: transcription termination/antitermination protein NusG [Planctomycetota bacterium]|nr:transcription termination/antitermination protein NusG [Planctomycetota bacterium]MDG2142479.1 transcription termination/antitermination protein NusG [Planctomycetota bacterium]